MILKLSSLVIFMLTLNACSSSRSTSRVSTRSPAHYDANLDRTASGSRSTEFRDNAYRQDVIQNARNYMGSKYRYGGTGGSGFDCSGFTSTVFSQSGLDIPRTSTAQSRFGKKLGHKDAKPGDLVFFGRGSVSHVGIVVENRKDKLLVIHSTKSNGIRVDDVLAMDYWRNRILWATDPYREFKITGSR